MEFKDPGIQNFEVQKSGPEIRSPSLAQPMRSKAGMTRQEGLSLTNSSTPHSYAACKTAGSRERLD